MPTRYVIPSLAVSSLLVLGCGGGGEPKPPETFEQACAEVEGCERPANTVDGPTEPIWRVLVVRDEAGAVGIETVEEFEAPESIGPPQGPLDGDYGLAALDAGGAPLELQRLRFPDTLLIEGTLDTREEVDVSGDEASTIGYLRVSAEVETLAIVEPDGTVVGSRDAPAPGEAVREDGDGDVGGAGEALVQAAPGSACGHVMLIEGGWDEIWYPNALQEEYPLREVTPLQRAVVRAALGRLTPTHCAGVGRIAFVRLAPRTGGKVVSVAGGYLGDVVLINADIDIDGLGFDDVSLTAPGQRARLTHTVIHEAAHATTYLLNGVAGIDKFSGDWAPTERDLAEETIDRVRLRAGFSREWSRVHWAFEELAWAKRYYMWPLEELQREELRSASPEGLAAGGFMSAYSGIEELEDIAEVATWPYVGDDYREAGLPEGPAPDTNDFGCIAMRAHDERNVPQALAAMYTKVSFLRDVGILSKEAFERCTGEHIGLPREHEGIAVYQDGELQRVFSDAPSAVIGTLEGRYVFEMVVEGGAEFDGETYPATLTMRVDLGPTSTPLGEIPVEKIPWPRGVYSLGIGTPHHFELRLDGAPAGDFNVTDGFILFADSSNDLLLGSVFAREAWRPHAPVPVPQTFDPPLQFRFYLQNGG